jgi:hypothetical protein
MPGNAANETKSNTPLLTNNVTAATGGISISNGNAMLASPTAAEPTGTLTHGAQNGNKTDRGLAYVILQILQQSTSLYRV